VVVIGAPEQPRLALCRRFGAEATVDITGRTTEQRSAAVRGIVGGFGADLVMNCSGHPSAGPEVAYEIGRKRSPGVSGCMRFVGGGSEMA
jgi:threonine dehydrogenase-like Zn-dependent dehydrogenase